MRCKNTSFREPQVFFCSKRSSRWVMFAVEGWRWLYWNPCSVWKKRRGIRSLASISRTIVGRKKSWAYIFRINSKLFRGEPYFLKDRREEKTGGDLIKFYISTNCGFVWSVDQLLKEMAFKAPGEVWVQPLPSFLLNSTVQSCGADESGLARQRPRDGFFSLTDGKKKSQKCRNPL